MLNAIAQRILTRRELHSRAVIRLLLEHSKRPYVAWSGGKDSTLGLWLALKEKPDIEAIYFDAAASLPGTEEFMEQIVKLWNVNFRRLRIRPLFEVYKEYGLDHPNIEVIANRSNVFEPATQLAKEGYDGAIICIRADESRGRRIASKVSGEHFYSKKHGIWQAWPMLWWKLEEVWLAHDYYNLPHHPAYDNTKFQPREELRVGYWAGVRNRQRGRWVWLKYYYPELFNELARMFPEARHDV